MKTLLIHALRSEAGLLRQHFPKATSQISRPGMEFLILNTTYDLLRTGMGLKQAQIALKSLPNITPYERVIHFGVSGSLTKDLSIQTLIRSSQFHAAGQTSIIMDPLTDFTLPDVNPSIFFSSVNAITDDDSRFKAASSGAQAVDMESYAIAEFCQSNDLPLLALRCISDRAGDSTPKDFPQHFDQASQRLQRYIIKHILKSTKVKL